MCVCVCTHAYFPDAFFTYHWGSCSLLYYWAVWISLNPNYFSDFPPKCVGNSGCDVNAFKYHVIFSYVEMLWECWNIESSLHQPDVFLDPSVRLSNIGSPVGEEIL